MTGVGSAKVSTRAGWLWGVAAVGTVVVAGVVPLLFAADYFWRGDTQAAYFGAYYRLGELLRQGELPLMEPFAWRGGNHIVEGNFGLLSPIVMAIGISVAGMMTRVRRADGRAASPSLRA